LRLALKNNRISPFIFILVLLLLALHALGSAVVFDAAVEKVLSFFLLAHGDSSDLGIEFVARVASNFMHFECILDEEEHSRVKCFFFYLWGVLSGEAFGELYHNFVHSVHNFVHGPAEDVEVDRFVFLRDLFFELFDLNLIFLGRGRGTEIVRMAPLLL
jgi:hypothetical protein